MATPIPVTLVGGWLGAGKTTLVNHLLRQRGERRIAVLVNDFGDLAIDADLIESRDGTLLQLAGGCVCCSFGSDLMAALQQMLALQPLPQHILIETSGVALPAAVARMLGLLQGLQLDAVLVLADAETLRERAADAYVGELVRQQLQDADLLLLNKTDLVADGALDALGTWLADAAPRSRLLRCQRAQLPPELLLGIGPLNRRTRQPPAAASPAPAPADRRAGPAPALGPCRPARARPQGLAATPPATLPLAAASHRSPAAPRMPDTAPAAPPPPAPQPLRPKPPRSGLRAPHPGGRPP